MDRHVVWTGKVPQSFVAPHLLPLLLFDEGHANVEQLCFDQEVFNHVVVAYVEAVEPRVGCDCWLGFVVEESFHCSQVGVLGGQEERRAPTKVFLVGKCTIFEKQVNHKRHVAFGGPV